MIQENNWHLELNKIPVICSILVKNDEKTIYDCLERSTKLFDAVLVILDNSNDLSALEIDKFLRRERPAHVFVFDLTNSPDPWPDLKTENATLSKAIFKMHTLAKELASNGIWFSTNAKIKLYETARSIILSNASKWSQPDIGHNFFTVEDEKENSENFTVSLMLRSPLFISHDSAGKDPSLFLRIEENLLVTKSSTSSKTCIGSML